MYVSVTRIANDDSDQMNEWDVQQETEHRNFAQDQHRMQQLRRSQVHVIEMEKGEERSFLCCSYGI